MNEERKIWHWLVLGLLSLIWGSSFILMKKGLIVFSSIQVGQLRIFFSFLCLLPFAVINLKNLKREQIKHILIIGFLGNGIPAFLFPIAQTRLDSSVAGMLNSLTPVFTLLVGFIIYNRKVVSLQTIGIVIGFLGAAGLVYKGSLSFDPYGVLIIIATFFYGISSNEVGRMKGLSGIAIASLGFAAIGPFAGVSLLFSDFSSITQTEGWQLSLLAIIALSVVGTAFAAAIFNILIIKTSPVFAVTVTYMIPIVATFWGILDNESLSSSMVVSVAGIMAGVYLVNKGARQSRRLANQQSTQVPRL